MITPERRARIESLFEQALELTPDERAALLGAGCEGDADLRAQVERLIHAHEVAEGSFLLRSAITVHPASTSPPLERIGDYRILEELGRGGMGIVYLAERERHRPRRRVAIKVLRDSAHAPAMRRRFEVERDVLAALDHANIARLLDGGIAEDDRPYLVMEYVDGKPIDRYCADRRLPIDDRLRLFCAVARAVHHAHRNLIVHRDLKPSNILVTEDGVPKLLDFGIAKLLDPAAAAAPLTATGYRPMTPEYASPEQVRGARITTATDVYALGVVLCELLTGQRPHSLAGLSPSERERVLLEAEPMKPSTLAAGRLQRRLRGDLDRIVLMALRKEAERRYPSAEQLAEDIERHLDGRPVLAHSDSRWYRARKFVRRHRVQTTAAAIAVLSLLGGSTTALWQAAVARGERDAAARALRQSEEVTTFLMGLFEASDPERERGQTITSRDLLERGLRRVDELDDQPLVQAQMLGVIGRVLERLGDYDRAQPLFERALARRRELLGDQHLDVAEALEALGLLLHKRQRYAEARPALAQSLAIRRSLLTDGHELTARGMHNLGLLYHTLARFDSAEALYRQALASHQLADSARIAEAIPTMFRLGVLFRDRGNAAAADSALRDVLALQRRTLGEEHADLARTMVQLASLRARRGDYRGAEDWLRQALAVRRGLYGEEHPDIATNLSQLASALAFQHRHEEAERLHRQALAQLRRFVGPDHSDIASALNSLALVAKARGDTTAAEALFHESLAMYQRVRGPEHPLTFTIMRNLARIRMDRGDLPAAESLYREILAGRRRSLGAEHPYVASSLVDLGRVLHRRRRFAAAEASYKEMLATFEHRLGESDRHYVTDAKHGLAALYEDWGRPDDAARFRPLRASP